MALISKASLLMVPSTYEPGTLYNVLPSGNRAPDNKGGAGYDQTRADFDFDRGSNAAATRIGSDGLIKKYRENFILHSNAFNDASWASTDLNVTSGATDPNGGSTAWIIANTAANGIIQKSVTLTGVRSISIYAKEGTHRYLRIGAYGGTNSYANFDLQNGVVSSGTQAVIESIGGGWYRCTAWGANGTTGGVQIFPSNNATSAPTTNGSIFIWRVQLESGLVATDYLDSTSVTGKAGVLVDLPRINYDANGENGALLLEPSRQQLIQYSEYFGASNWNKTRATISDNVSVSPEGVQNAAKIISTAVDNSHYIRHDVSSTTGVCYVFAKADDFTFLKLATNAHSFSPSFFNLTNGEVTKSALYDAEIETYGNGWYKCIIKPTDAFTQFFIENAGDSASATHLGDGVKGVFIYGAQIEAGSYATSYIPNHGESGGVTRAADSCSVTGASDVIGQTEGVVFLDVDTIHNNSDTGPTKWFLEVRKDANNSFGIGSGGADAAPAVRFVTKIAGVVSTDAEPAGFSDSKIAIKYTASEFKIFQNGSLKATISKNIGGYVDVELMEGAANDLTMPLKQFILFDEALTDAECVTLTTL